MRATRGRLLWGCVPGLLLAALLLPRPAVAAKPEWVAVGSLILPGVGQMANGDWGTGAFQFGLSQVLVRQYLILSEDENFIEPEDRVDEDTNTIRINRTTFQADLYATGLLNLSFYSAFGAYRDARQALGNRGYITPAPEESLGDLAGAPFRPKYLLRLTTFLPLLVPLAFALTPADDERLLYQPEGTLNKSELAQGFFLQHEMVAVGEEAFFRGVLNNGLSSSLGEFWGLALSSLAFGLAHDGTVGSATPGSATVFGLYLGWLHQRNGYQVGEGVALHFWWNFFISMGMLQQRESEQHITVMSVSIPF